MGWTILRRGSESSNWPKAQRTRRRPVPDNADIVEFQAGPFSRLAGPPNPPLELCGRQISRDFITILPPHP